ncbi:BIRC7_8 [Mytilus edulis]|uniref:BIRC7_8 n=1 Tax=Mytilus edulis TaxID=6550 RepID=A0A8S3PRL9_MYTED|nr:BIRC7_8 [Mytilus edulis]
MDGSDTNTQSDTSHQPSSDSQIIINGLRPQVLVTKPVENLTASTKIQQTTDAMNSQLTIDANFSRLEEPEYKYPQYQSYSSRLRSFDQWRFAHKQTPQCLSEAGYFYTIYNAKHAAFDDKMSRIATFDGDWRRDIEQTPEILADAGFFYTDNLKDNAVVKELLSMELKVDDIKYATDRYIKSKGDNDFCVEDLIDLIFEKANEEHKQSPFAVNNIINTEKPEENGMFDVLLSLKNISCNDIKNT